MDIAVGDGGLYVIEAVSLAHGERFIVRGSEPQAVAVELARQFGIELEEGGRAIGGQQLNPPP